MKPASKAEAFENVKRQIGFCGIWCGSCVVGNGALRQLTEKYGEIIRAYGLEGWAPEGFDYEKFSKGLKSIESVASCPGCLKGGGRDNCEMRTCASEKKVDDCSECREFAACNHVGTLEKMRSGALNAGLFVKLEDIDGQKLIEEWTIQLKNKWPSCILFMNDR